MMMMRSRFLASSLGSAEMPSSSGISMSSTATSGLMRSIWLTASSPVRSDASTFMSGSASIQREIMPRITTESSTTMTRIGSCRVAVVAVELINAVLITYTNYGNQMNNRPAAIGRRVVNSDQSDFLEFRRDDILVERLHDVFIGAGMKRASDVRHV